MNDEGLVTLSMNSVALTGLVVEDPIYSDDFKHAIVKVRTKIYYGRRPMYYTHRIKVKPADKGMEHIGAGATMAVEGFFTGLGPIISQRWSVWPLRLNPGEKIGTDGKVYPRPMMMLVEEDDSERQDGDVL